MNIEIERKFLVTGDYRSIAESSAHIRQAYINSRGEKTVRVRIRGERAYLTIKSRSLKGCLGRMEWEKELSLPEAEDLLKLAEPGMVDKTRYLIPDADGVHIWEVDEFHGDSEGLVVAEVELRSEDDSVVVPPWAGPEVTGDRRYCNSYIAEHPWKMWKQDVPSD